MDRNYLKGRLGDRINAVLAAAGYNFSLLLRWLAELLRVIIRAFIDTVPGETPNRRWSRWKRCCSVATRKSLTPTSRTTSGAFRMPNF